MSFEVFMQVWCLQKSKLWWKQGKTGEKNQDSAIFVQHFLLCENFAQHFLLCENFAQHIPCVNLLLCQFQKCMLSVPSQNLSANFTRMRTLCEFVFVTKFQNHALCHGEPQECEIFAQHSHNILCCAKLAQHPPLCEFLSFFIPTLPNPKPLSLVLNCSKWGPLIIFVNI